MNQSSDSLSATLEFLTKFIEYFALFFHATKTSMDDTYICMLVGLKYKQLFFTARAFDRQKLFLLGSSICVSEF